MRVDENDNDLKRVDDRREGRDFSRLDVQDIADGDGSAEMRCQ